jgi:N-acetylmuramic acid 6-phosphate (MurNAc-6-P) etherase
MALNGSEAVLAEKLQSMMKTAGSYEDAWQRFAEILISHLIQNAVVVGIAPSGGGPVSQGKLQ